MDVSEFESQSVQPLIEDTIEQLHKLIHQFESKQIPNIYIEAVHQLSGCFDHQLVIEQSDNRFYSLKNDSLLLKWVKMIKRSRRRLQQKNLTFINRVRRVFRKPEKKVKPWFQKIPIKQVIEYHLLVRPELAQRCIDEDERLLSAFIVELEEHLAVWNSLKTPDQEFTESKDTIKNLISDFLKKIQHQQSGMKENFEQDSISIQNTLLEHIEKAGTFEKRASFYDESRLQNLKKKTEEKLKSHLEQWKKVQTSLLRKTETVNRFLIFKQKLIEKTVQFSSSLKSYFNDHFYYEASHITKNISDVQAHLLESNQKSAKKEQAYLISVQQQLLNQLLQLEDLISTSLEKKELQELAEVYAEDLVLLAHELSETTTVVESLQLEKNPPLFNSEIMEWRLLVIRTLKDQLLDKIKPSEQHYDKFLLNAITELQETARVIEVNLGYAAELFAENKENENPIDIASKALERSQLKVEQLRITVQDNHNKLEFLIHQDSEVFVNRILTLLHSGDSNDIQLLDAKYRVKETTQNWKTKLSARWARTYDSLTVLWRFWIPKAKKYIQAIKTSLGFQKVIPRQDQKMDVAHYLSETDSKLDELPYIYRRLFNFHTESDRRFYVTKQENFTSFSKALERWKNGFPATIALVGEKGSGKSTYLNFAANEVFANEKIKRITLTSTYRSGRSIIELLNKELDISEANNIDSVIAALRKKKRIVVLEALQNLYLRNTRGYEALETFLYIISETKDMVFWVTSCSSYAWNFLQKALSLNDYFTHILRTDNLTDKQIEHLIVKRHEASGYKVVFEPSESQSKNRAYRKLMDNETEAQEYLSREYFKELAEISQGNASIAMILWVRSIREFTDTHFYISPMEVASVSLEEDFSPNVLFTFAAIILHDTLTPEQLSLILQFNEQESRMMLTRLKTQGLLKQTGEYFTLNHLIYRQLVKVLKERNIIHLY